LAPVSSLHSLRFPNTGGESSPHHFDSLYNDFGGLLGTTKRKSQERTWQQHQEANATCSPALEAQYLQCSSPEVSRNNNPFFDYEDLYGVYHDCVLLSTRDRYGLEIKDINTIVEKWPFRLKGGKYLDAERTEFRLHRNFH
jgi:hypothetical protein